jgi:hypothetical protein
MERDKQIVGDVVAHPTLVVTRESADVILKQIETGEPSEALCRLLRGSSPYRRAHPLNER